jgi:hypothetical protein
MLVNQLWKRLSYLAYLGIGFGFIGGLAMIAFTNDRLVMAATAKNGGRHIHAHHADAEGEHANDRNNPKHMLIG